MTRSIGGNPYDLARDHRAQWRTRGATPVIDLGWKEGVLAVIAGGWRFTARLDAAERCVSKEMAIAA